MAFSIGSVSNVTYTDGAVLSGTMLGSHQHPLLGSLSTAQIEELAITAAKIAAGAVTQTAAPTLVKGAGNNYILQSTATSPASLGATGAISTNWTFPTAFTSSPVVSTSFTVDRDLPTDSGAWVNTSVSGLNTTNGTFRLMVGPGWPTTNSFALHVLAYGPA